MYGHSVIAFATEIAAVVAWRSRHASEFPADVVLYTWVLSNPCAERHAVGHILILEERIVAGVLGSPGRGASTEPQALISSAQKLAQTSPPLQPRGGVAVS